MNTKILFLDIDGVLNSPSFLAGAGDYESLDPRAILLLNKVVRETDCDIVISSTWRLFHTLSSLKSIFRFNGFMYENNIIGITTLELSGRGLQILDFLKSYREDKVIFAVIDDDDFDMDPIKDRLVKTNTLIGMKEEHADRLIQMLNMD